MRIRGYLFRWLLFLILVVSLSGVTVFALELRMGSRGPEVRKLQQDLVALGYDPGVVDGIFGEKVREAVKIFQRDQSLAINGIAGPEMRERIREAILTPKIRVDQLYQIARDHYLVGEIRESAKKLEEALELDPTNIRAQLLSEALTEEVEALRKEEAKGYYEKGKALYRKGSYEEARKEFDRAKEIFPDYKPVDRYLKRTNRRLVLIQERKKEEIRKEKKGYLREVEKDQKKKITHLLKAGRVYYKESKFSEAIVQFEKVLILDPQNGKAKKYLLKTKEAREGGEEKKIKNKVNKAKKERKKRIKELYSEAKRLYRKGEPARTLLKTEEILILDSDHYGARRLIEKITTSPQIE